MASIPYPQHRPTRRRSPRIRSVLVVLVLCAAVAISAALIVSPALRHEAATVVSPPLGPGTTFEMTDAHGYIATGSSVDLGDDGLPAIANLDAALRDAARAAAAAAAEDGIRVVVTSGWRSAAYQQWLFDRAVAKYGDAAEASRWVAPADLSHHVTGRAIDVGPFDATLWMQSHGPDFGLCQIYANELWHYELAADYGGTCPALQESAAG